MSTTNTATHPPPPPHLPNFCVDCGTAIPKPATVRTACVNPKCATPVANWFDFERMLMRRRRMGSGSAEGEEEEEEEDQEEGVQSPQSQSQNTLQSQAHSSQAQTQSHSQYHNAGLGERFETISLNDRLNGGDEHGGDGNGRRRVNRNGVEERFFLGSLLVLEGHFQRPQTYMGKAMVEVKKMIAGTLEMSLNKADVRETLAKNVSIWMRLRRIFHFAIPLCERRSLSSTHHDPGTGPSQEVAESASLILKHSTYLCEDLHLLNSLLVISRNMLAIKETAQEICAAVGFDVEVKRLIELCVQVTSKGYDGETVVNEDRGRLLEVTELYKKVLVTCLQHTHNWTMGNDRFKMSFWFDMLFDDEWRIDSGQDLLPEEVHIRTIWEEVKNWLARHSMKDPLAQDLLDEYEDEVEYGVSPGPLPILDGVSGKGHLTLPESTSPVWKHEERNKIEQDRLYARVSHEIDIWWKRVRDQNYDGWVVPMETVEGAKERAEACKDNAMDRYMPRGQDREYDHLQDPDGLEDEEGDPEHDHDTQSLQAENGDDLEGEEEEDDDDDEYVEGPLRGLLTEIPNILDTKQIEALHMTVKACVVDSMGSGLTPAGENLQKTRCKMFLALDCGKNLLREMLVFIAVWEQNDAQFIFQITAQIIESFHHNALLPYAWESLRIVKDIVSPAQTVLLRLINYMFRARKDSPIYDDLRDYNRDAKLIHFLYNYFRCRVVPDCIALISAQTQIRLGKKHPGDFPVDLWDMERAKDGLSQYLDFISVVAEIAEMRPLLIEWEAVYELIALLKALEQGVARKSIDERPMPTSSQTPQQQQQQQHANSNLPPLHDTPHKFPWSGIKIQLLIILTSLLSPTSPRRTGPGNPIVQNQLLTHDGLMPLLNCCVYDGHNEYLKERATLAIKFAMEGCMEAQNYVKELVPVRQAQAKRVEAQQRELEGLRGVMRTVGEYREMWGTGLQGGVVEGEEDDEGSEGEEFVDDEVDERGNVNANGNGNGQRRGDVAFLGPGALSGQVERRG